MPRAVKLILVEFSFAAAFVVAIFWGDHQADITSGSITRIAAVAVPIVILTAWWIFYARHISGLGEFERAVATRSLAVACGVTIWVTTVWGIISLILDAPALPLVLVAPVAVVIYSVIRSLFMRKYL